MEFLLFLVGRLLAGIADPSPLSRSSNAGLARLIGRLERRSTRRACQPAAPAAAPRPPQPRRRRSRAVPPPAAVRPPRRAGAAAVDDRALPPPTQHAAAADPPPHRPHRRSPASASRSASARNGSFGSAALALALGGFFLVRYSIEQGWFGPGVRVFLGALLALALIAAGEWARRSEQLSGITGMPTAHIPSILTAAGTTVAYADVYAAYALYDFLGAGRGLRAARHRRARDARRQRCCTAPRSPALGLVGAYVTPLLVASDQPNYWALYLYLAVVTAAAFALARARLWRWLAITAVAFGLLWTVPRHRRHARRLAHAARFPRGRRLRAGRAADRVRLPVRARRRARRASIRSRRRRWRPICSARRDAGAGEPATTPSR